MTAVSWSKAPAQHSFVRAAYVVWLRDIVAYRKYARSSFTINLTEPLIGLLGIGVGLGAYVSLGHHLTLVQFIAPGLVMTSAMMATSFDMLFEGYNRLHWNPIWEGMLLTPLRHGEIVAGELAWEATRAVIYGGCFMAVTALFGLIRSPLVLLVLPLLAVTGVLFAAPALIVATYAKVENHLFYYVALFITPSSYMSGTFFPIDRLPFWLKDVIWLTPLYHVARITRALYGGELDSSLLIDLGVMGAWIAITVPIAARRLRTKLTS